MTRKNQETDATKERIDSLESILEKYRECIISRIKEDQVWSELFFKEPVKTIVETFKLSDEEQKSIHLSFEKIKKEGFEILREDTEHKADVNQEEAAEGYAAININLMDIKKLVRLISIAVLKDKEFTFKNQGEHSCTHNIKFSYLFPDINSNNESVWHSAIAKGERIPSNNSPANCFSTADLDFYLNLSGLQLYITDAGNGFHNIEITSKEKNFISKVQFKYWEPKFGDKADNEKTLKDGINEIPRFVLYKTDLFTKYNIPADLFPMAVSLSGKMDHVTMMLRKIGWNDKDLSIKENSLRICSYLPLTVMMPYVRDFLKLKNETDLYIENNSIKNRSKFTYNVEINDWLSIQTQIDHINVSLINNGISLFADGNITWQKINLNWFPFSFQVDVLADISVQDLNRMVPDFQKLSIAFKKVKTELTTDPIFKYIYI